MTTQARAERDVRDDALIKAIRREEWHKCRYLLSRTDDAHRLVSHKNDFGECALHEASRWNAPIDVVVSVVDALNENRSENGEHDEESVFIRRCERDGSVALHWAVYRSSEEVVVRVLRSAPFAAGVGNGTGARPLHVAVIETRAPSVVRRLLEARPEAARVEDDSGRDPLRLALLRWAQELGEVWPNLRRLPDGSALDGGVEGWETIRETLLLLLRARALGTIDAADEARWRPLHEALRTRLLRNRPTFLLALLRTMGRECARRDANGNFPLHATCV